MQLAGHITLATWRRLNATRRRIAVAGAALAEAERGRFALWLAIAVVAGAVAYFTPASEPWAMTGARMIAAGILLAALLGRRRPLVRAVGLLAIAGGLGFGAAQLATARAPPLVELPSRATIAAGTVRMVQVLPEGRRVTLGPVRLDDGAVLPRAVRIRLRADDPVEVATGDTLRVRALVRPPSGATHPGGWDIQFDAFYAGLAGYGYALNPAERLAADAPRGVMGWMKALQEAIILRVHAALPGAEGRIAAGLMVGGSTAIPVADQAAFRDSGIYHLLSLSGLHLGIAMGLVFAAVRLALAAWEWGALRLPTKAIAALCALLGGGFYTLLTGAQVPMLRSFAMAALVTLGIMAGRRALSLRGWALALVAVALVAPQEVVRVSFQLSFAAVLALVAGFEALRPWLLRVQGDGAWPRRAGAYLATLVMTSALAGTATLPFIAYHFGSVQIYYVLSNMLAVPLTAVVVMPAAVLAMLLMPLGLESLALVPMGLGVQALAAIARTVAAWPEAVVAVPHIAPWGLAGLSLGLVWLALWRSRLRLLGAPMIALGLLSAGLHRPPDILVSGDARLIALRTEAGLHVQRSSGGSAFVLESWQRYLAGPAWQAMPAAGQASADGAVECGATSCVLRPHPGGAAALLLRGPPDAAACRATVVISAEPARLECAERVPLVDRFTVWREGAHAIWLDSAGPRIVSDRATRGTRPWVIPLPTRTQQPPGKPLPPAEVDVPAGSATGEDDPE